ncbi:MULTISPECIES: hypothetical protein [Streptomyces]|uniref:Uncharacterized protein n=1 Tax=Streptomyces alkaliphilus TaxID=1472722 RepID=A0A7W3Y4D2_9ACTN|nr:MULTISPECIES: hypothetical protein [Streptomyces]MBB0247257.1 hypothetical protein [Streptomyces alkaliphilus]MCE7081719.1 hypothetical protein [Streptomyces sp. ST2-7A]
MRTCPRFASLREEYEREIGYLSAHARQHAGKPSAKSSAKHAASTRARMARALNGHLERCPECG